MTIQNRLGEVDILVHNAGSGMISSILDEQTTPEMWQDSWNKNVLSFVETLRLVLPGMKRKQSGRVIVVGSASGKQPTKNQFISNVTKGSLIPLVKSLAEELAPHNILVNNVCPGRFLTPQRERRVRELAAAGMDEKQYYEELAATIPLRRIGRPEEIADFIVFLASERASYITGQSINVDGGLIRATF